MTRRGRQRAILFLVLLMISALAGPVYVWFAYPGMTAALWRSGIDGAIGGTLLWGGLLFVWPSRPLEPLRRQSFPVRLACLCTYAIVVTAITAMLASLRITGTISLTTVGVSWTLYAYVIAITLLLLVIVQVVQMIGPRAIANVLFGRYHNPVEEERVFLFVDLADSTALARRLGDQGVQRLISRFVFDITNPILEHGGEIHAYVGDEVIVTWPLAKGIRNGTCLHCYFAIQDCLLDNAAAYQESFQTVPRVRAGLHGGPVVVSEIGDVKTALVYFGDTVNIAARLEDAAKRHDQDLVTSGAMIRQMKVPPGFRVTKVGEEILRGHDAPTELIAITRGE